jgi:hypothetical protein
MKLFFRSQFPECIRHFKDLKGICVGECVDPEETIGKKHAAHAHSFSRDKYQGWICLKYKYHLKQPLLLLHEIAHLIANKRYSTPTHGKRWRQALLKIGGTFKSFVYRRGNYIYTNLDYTYRPRKQ